MFMHAFDSTASPSQSFPPLAGGGLLQVLERVCVPFPQPAEQAPQSLYSLHPPSTESVVLIISQQKIITQLTTPYSQNNSVTLHLLKLKNYVKLKACGGNLKLYHTSYDTFSFKSLLRLFQLICHSRYLFVHLFTCSRVIFCTCQTKSENNQKSH